MIIAAQTAPVTELSYGNRVSFSGTDNLICRYLRVRMGMNGREGKDAAGIAYGSDMIFDHMSVTWGRDECFSINGDPKSHLPDQPEYHYTEFVHRAGTATPFLRRPYPDYDKQRAYFVP